MSLISPRNRVLDPANPIHAPLIGRHYDRPVFVNVFKAPAGSGYTRLTGSVYTLRHVAQMAGDATGAIYRVRVICRPVNNLKNRG